MSATHTQDSHLGVEGGVLDVAVDEEPQVVLDHEGLDVCILVLLVDLLNQGPAAGSTITERHITVTQADMPGTEWSSSERLPLWRPVSRSLLCLTW